MHWPSSTRMHWALCHLLKSWLSNSLISPVSPNFLSWVIPTSIQTCYYFSLLKVKPLTHFPALRLFGFSALLSKNLPMSVVTAALTLSSWALLNCGDHITTLTVPLTSLFSRFQWSPRYKFKQSLSPLTCLILFVSNHKPLPETFSSLDIWDPISRF